MEKLQHFLETEKPLNVLDIGTGSGNFLYILSSLYNDFNQMVGIDTSKAAIESAKSNSKDDRFHFDVMDATKLDYPDDGFDLVCLSNSLHHLKDTQSVLKEMIRVCKPTGHILVSEMISNTNNAKQYSHKLLHHFAAKVDRMHQMEHNDTYTDSQIKDILHSLPNANIDSSWIIQTNQNQEITQEELDWIRNVIDRILKRVPEDLLEEFSKEAQNIKDYILQNGYESAPTLMTILKEKK